MPGGILPSEGLADQLSYILSASIPGLLPWQLLLWTGDLVPDADTVLADLVECTFGGYSRATLTRSTWTTPVISPDGCAGSTWGTTPILWYMTGSVPQEVSGYAMIDAGLGLIRFIQRFDDADIVTVMPGSKYQILPRYTLTTGQC